MGHQLTLITITFSGLTLAASASMDRIPAGRVSSTPIAPEWSKKANLVKKDSNPYLRSQRVLRNASLPEQFFDAVEEKRLCAVRQNFERRYTDHELRRNHGLTRAPDEKAYANSMQNFSRDALTGVAQSHARGATRRMSDFAQYSASTVREPVAIAVLAASVYSGRTFRFNLAGVRTESRLDGKDRAASVALHLPLLRPSVRYEGSQVNGALRAAVTKNVDAVVDSAEKGTASVQYNLSF